MSLPMILICPPVGGSSTYSFRSSPWVLPHWWHACSYSGEDVAPALYLVPMAVAVMTGLWRPGLLGSIGAWRGWSAGVGLGWLIDTGELSLAGPAAMA
jgi:hypothetical protein